jgi:hypothetical protein
MCQYIGISCINKPESLFENFGCEDAVVVLANIHTCTSTQCCHSCYASVLIVLALVMFIVICQEENYCSTDWSSISG